MYSKGLEIVRDVRNVGNVSEEVRSKVWAMTSNFKVKIPSMAMPMQHTQIWMDFVPQPDTYSLPVEAPLLGDQKKQTVTALSSTEAEYIALSEAARDAKWLQSLYNELGYEQKGPTLLLGDNNGSIAMANNAQFHKRLKHIKIRYHWTQEQIQQGHLFIEEC